MAERPRVSVVMAVRDGAAYLGQAVDSILGQTLRDLELVVVDDGSADTTPELLRRAASADPRMRVLRQEPVGLVAALNRGCAAAQAPYIARMDADDVAFPDRLARQAEWLDRNPRVALVGSAVMRIDAAGRELKRNVCPTTHAEIVRELDRYNCFTHSTVMIRADRFAAAGGYREAYLHAEDHDLWLRMSERDELANLPDPLLYYRVYPDQVSMRHLEQQVVSSVGARAAARIRRATGQDPTPSQGPVTPALLHAWGVDQAALARAMDEGYRYAVYLMQQSGLRRGAVARLRGDGRLQQLLADACWREAGISLRRGRIGEGLAWGIEAWRARRPLRDAGAKP